MYSSFISLNTLTRNQTKAIYNAMSDSFLLYSLTVLEKKDKIIL